jgi:hypothetical protein
MPNSRLLQQMLKFDFERYQEDINDGKSILDPTVVCIQRGIIAFKSNLKMGTNAHVFRYSHSLSTGTMEGRSFSIFPATFGTC